MGKMTNCNSNLGPLVFILWPNHWQVILNAHHFLRLLMLFLSGSDSWLTCPRTGSVHAAQPSIVGKKGLMAESAVQ